MGHRSQALLNHSFSFVKYLTKFLFEYKNELLWNSDDSFYSLMDLQYFSVQEYAGLNAWET